MALVVVADAVSTKRILADPIRRKEINAAGALQVDTFVGSPTLDSFIEKSRRFAFSARLVPPPVALLLEEIGEPPAGQCQLGGSVFVFDPSAATRKVLERAGPVIMTGVDEGGARVVGSG